jgi:hypothetical protein
MVLCLRGGREHHTLKLSQFVFSTDSLLNGSSVDVVTYAENGSKNRSGSYKDRSENKAVKQYAEPALGERCYVSLLKLYFSKLPTTSLEKNVFYLHPKDKTPLDEDSPWFIQSPLGRNTLQSMVKKICEEVGVQGKTNHSLRATGAARLFESNVPEKLVQERTGHRSIEALRLYERTSLVQQHSCIDEHLGG